jgi:hypothetical protein
MSLLDLQGMGTEPNVARGGSNGSKKDNGSPHSSFSIACLYDVDVG